MGESFKDYLRRHLRTSGVRTQLALAERIGMDYGQLNKIFTGKTQRPEIETLEKIAPAIRRPIDEVMQAAGYPVPALSGVPVARQLVLQALDGDEQYDASDIVRYVESRPGQRFQQQLSEAREARAYPDYVAFCVRIFRAWESNSDLGLEGFRFGRGPRNDGL